MTSAKAVSFLAKKSWHTATMRHMEKVWKAEERSKAENKKLSELQQELAEEREMESLRRAHENLTGKRKADRVEFLYSEPLLNEPSSDDYLLGSKYKSKDEDNDVKSVKDKPGSLWLDQPAITSDSIQDKRAKIREDPLFAIKKEEQNQKASLKNNPIKMQKLREQILKQKLLEEFKKEKKRKRKSEKYEKSEKHKKQKIETSEPVETYHRSDRRDHHHGERSSYRPERYREEGQRYRPHKSSHSSSSKDRSSRKKTLTEEEKQKKLEEMRRDAEKLEKERMERIINYNKEDAEERARARAISKDNKIDPSFINSMGKEVYTSGSTASLEDRVKRNKFYIQKTDLDERGMF